MDAAAARPPRRRCPREGLQAGARLAERAVADLRHRAPRVDGLDVGDADEREDTAQVALVSREVTAAVPVRVDYALTDLGRTLIPALAALREWSTENYCAVVRARQEYDGAATG